MPTSVQIHGGEFQLRRIFSDEFAFRIPNYQRPYSWEQEQALELVDDLLGSLGTIESMEDLEPYFLGNIVLIKGEQTADAEVVDGQQRLTTLTILLAVLAKVLPSEAAKDIQTFLYQAANALSGTSARFRLELRERDAHFFRKHIQEAGGLTILASLEAAQLTDAQRHIRTNAGAIERRLSSLPLEQVARLATFLVQSTYLVVVSTPNLNSAYRIFSVLNERGLQLSPADILKARVLGEIPHAEQQKYTNTWEDLEDSLGRDRFSELFSHIRMLFARAKARGTLISEFDSAVFSRVPPGALFIDEVVERYADAFRVIVGRCYESTSHAATVNRLLDWLGRLDNFDWTPPAMLWLASHGTDEDAVLAFIRDLERLAASMLIRREDINRRIERYGRLLAEIEKGSDLWQPSSSLQLTEKECQDTVAALNGDLYLATRVRLYALLRLDSALSTGGATYSYPVLTIEHVLPQTMEMGSEWNNTFTYSQQMKWVHRVANLVLLTRRKNSQASNLEFSKKKQTYFTSSGGTSPFALTTQVLAQTSWNEQVLTDRQAKLIAELTELWRLSLPAQADHFGGQT